MKEPKDPTLRGFRERAGLSQIELAERMHIGAKVLSERERRYMVQDLPIRFVISYVEACGGELALIAICDGVKTFLYRRTLVS